MNFNNLIVNASKKYEIFKASQNAQIYTILILFILCLYIGLKVSDTLTESKKIEVTTKRDYQKGRLFPSSFNKNYQGKEKILKARVNDVLEKHEGLLKRLNDQNLKIEELENKIQEAKQKNIIPKKEIEKEEKTENGTIANIRVHPGSGSLESTYFESTDNTKKRLRSNFLSNKRRLISFPVASTRKKRKDEITLPSGSYVKAKLLTGVEAPEGRTYPVLLQLDFAHILPNDKKLDLIGCFIIAKAQGDLSTERVQMQATKLSCVAKSGKMFEREINGFVADDSDNSFAVVGKVNSKQGRVASMAFLSSVVEGVGKAIQAAQTNQQVDALGGSRTVISGDSGKYIAAGGVSNAASQVTQWYLKQAQSLLPTINIGSGQDVWVVMAEKVSLPKDYFNNQRSSENESVYSYFTNILK